MVEQFVAVALTVADPLHLAAAAAAVELAEDHALRFLPTNNYSVYFLVLHIFSQYGRVYVIS